MTKTQKMLNIVFTFMIGITTIALYFQYAELRSLENSMGQGVRYPQVSLGSIDTSTSTMSTKIQTVQDVLATLREVKTISGSVKELGQDYLVTETALLDTDILTKAPHNASVQKYLTSKKTTIRVLINDSTKRYQMSGEKKVPLQGSIRVGDTVILSFREPIYDTLAHGSTTPIATGISRIPSSDR